MHYLVYCGRAGRRPGSSLQTEYITGKKIQKKGSIEVKPMREEKRIMRNLCIYLFDIKIHNLICIYR